MLEQGVREQGGILHWNLQNVAFATVSHLSADISPIFFPLHWLNVWVGDLCTVPISDSKTKSVNVVKSIWAVTWRGSGVCPKILVKTLFCPFVMCVYGCPQVPAAYFQQS